MFGRKKPEVKAVDSTTESERTTSYRVGQDSAPPATNVNRTTSYVNSMQHDGRGYETLN